ncbi:MAG: PKD domain-containing protein [Candidatus Dadabacteria bacterium]|nr:PKD domain-containing protein [Candidatus Dadabacteria bacterium]
MKYLSIIAVFSFFIFSFLIIPSSNVSASDTITVGLSGPPTYDFNNINDAISSANESDIIQVYPGTYIENIVINKDLDLTGVDGSSSTIIYSASSNQNTIEINSDEVTITGFTIKNRGGSFACLKLNSVSNCLIKSNIIQNGGNGVYLVGSNINTIEENTVKNNNVGIYLSNSDNNIILSNNILYNNANGVFIASTSTGNTLYLNDFSDNADSNARDFGSNNWDYSSQGNYWDDYNDYDINGDGIGDNPYIINGEVGNQDNYPLGDFLSPNQIPIAYIDSITPNPAIQGQTISFNGHGSDDGSIIAWEWRSNGILIGTSEDFEKSDLSAGSYSIGFRVQDNEEEWSDFVFKTLIVNPESNTPPSAYISEPQKSTYIYGETVHFIGSGNDIDGDSITGYLWRSVPAQISSNDQSFLLSNIPVGEYAIYFKVRDSKGDWSQETTKSITIISDPTIPNNAPVADAGGPYIGTVNKTITFDGSSSYDPDTDDTLTFSWNFGDGTTGEGVSPDHMFTSEGNYTVVLTVIDNHGEPSTSTANLEVKSNEITEKNSQDKDGITGFEIIFVFIAISIIFIIKKYRK